MEKLPLNRFLQSRAEVDACTQWLKDNNAVPHPLECKNFDMRNIVPYIEPHYDILDMGCIGSGVLDNAAKLNTTGLRHGIDLLFKPEDIDDGPVSWNNANTPKVPGCKFFQGDLMHTGLSSESYDMISCMSVIEHSVDFNAFAQECSRLLKKGGKLYITTDYWPDIVSTANTILYDLNWSIQSQKDIENLIRICASNGLIISSDVDWTTNEAVINPSFCSPTNVSYTFGIFEFIKN